jgi:hypothetical protein
MGNDLNTISQTGVNANTLVTLYKSIYSFNPNGVSGIIRIPGTPVTKFNVTKYDGDILASIETETDTQKIGIFKNGFMFSNGSTDEKEYVRFSLLDSDISFNIPETQITTIDDQKLVILKLRSGNTKTTLSPIASSEFGIKMKSPNHKFELKQEIFCRDDLCINLKQLTNKGHNRVDIIDGNITYNEVPVDSKLFFKKDSQL